MTYRTPNPYRPPGAEPGRHELSQANVHEWCGHSIRVAAQTRARTLWLVNSLLVSVDGEPPVTLTVPVGSNISVTFQHEQRRVHSSVTRTQCFAGGRIEYTLLVEQEPIDKGRLQTGVWRHAMLVLAGPFTFAITPVALLFGLPWYGGLACLVAAAVWSVATIRLVARDHALVFPG